MIGEIFTGVPHAAFGGAMEHENGIALHWRGVGVGCSERKDPPLKAEAFFPLPRGGVSREVCEPSLAFLKRCDLYYGVLYHKKI